MANEFKVKKGLIVEGSGGTILDIQGSVGQLFSITDSLTGDLFAVSDISGIPILNVNSSGAVDIDGDLSVTDDVTLSNFGAGYLKTNVNGVVSNTATIPWSTVSSTPTTISGYGITDALSTTGKAADSELLDGVDSTRFVYGGNSTKTTNISSFSTALNSGFFDGNSATGSPTATWYTLLNMRHNNTNNNYGSQLAVSFYSNADMYVRTINNGTYSGWSKVYNEANLTPLTIGTTATTAMAGNTTTISSAQATAITANTAKVTDTGTPAILSSGSVPSLNTNITEEAIRDLIGAGTGDSNLAIGTTATTAMAGNTTIPTNNNQLTNGAGYITSYVDTQYSAGSGLDLTSTTFSVEPDLRDGITHVGKDANNYIQFDSTNGRIDFYAGGVFVARMESDGDLHIKGDVIAFSDIFS